ncbi:MAG: DNA primase, partial [Bdellovibrionota bacterium]
LMGRCPFPDHSDKSPSFSVTEDNQLYFCYGCKKGGNVFTFLETYNGMSFPESVEFLARRASIPLPEPEPGQPKRTGLSSDQKDLYLKINRAAGVFFHHQLKSQTEDSPAKKYLEKRGLSDDIVEKFRLGLTLDDWQGLAKHFESKRVPLEMAEALGLVKPKKNAPRTGALAEQYFDLFRDRLMFPIFSPTSDVIGFGGRTLGDALPKYVNSSDSPVFNKSRVLYGLHETGKFIRAQDEAIVVEGYMDAISLYAAGIKNVVAILGTAFTPEHAKLLKRYTVNVKMLLDGDEAGISGAERSLPVLLEAGLMPKGFVLPDKMDPDDYVKSNGADALRTEIARAPELFNLLLTKRWMANYHGSASEKVQIVDEAAMALKGMQNRQLMDLYLLEMTNQLDVDMNWLRRALQQSTSALQARTVRTSPQASGPGPSGASQGGGQSASPRPFHDEARQGSAPLLEQKPEALTEEPAPRVVMKGAQKDEIFVLSLILHNEIHMREFLEAGPTEVAAVFSHEGVRTLLLRAVRRYDEKPESFANLAANLASEVDQPGLLGVSVPLTPEDVSEVEIKKLMASYLGSVKTRFQKAQLREMTQEIRDRPSAAKLEEFMNLQRQLLGGPDREGGD